MGLRSRSKLKKRKKKGGLTESHFRLPVPFVGQKLLRVPEGKGQTQLCHWHMFHLGSKAVLAAERREIEAELNDNEGEERNPTRSDAFGYVSSRLPIFFAGFLMMGREKVSLFPPFILAKTSSLARPFCPSK